MGGSRLSSSLKEQLIALAQRDLQTRERLAADQSLFNGYHPEMQAVHKENATILKCVIDAHGWPTPEIAGEDGAEAAWLIAQHAIGLPDFQRKCLRLLKEAGSSGAVPAWQAAMLLDRICIFEGKPQVYGTSFDWDEDGLMSPLPIADPANVDVRRTAVGLPPLAEAIARHRAQAEMEPKPTSYSERQRSMEEWAKVVGWR